MLAYPFSDYEYTSKYFLADHPKTVIKNNFGKTVEGFSKIFFVGGDPEGEQYFVDGSKSESPVFALDPKTGKYSIKAKTWEEFLDVLRADIKDLEEEIAAERELERQPQTHSNGNIWTKNLTPSIWSWLGPVLGLLLVYGGIKAILREELRYRLWIYHGVAAIIGGVGMLFWAYLMFRAGTLLGKRTWNKLDIAIGICSGMIFLGFLVSRWIDVLR